MGLHNSGVLEEENSPNTQALSSGRDGMDAVVVEVILQWVAARGAHQHQLWWMAPLNKPNSVEVESDSSDGNW